MRGMYWKLLTKDDTVYINSLGINYSVFDENRLIVQPRIRMLKVKPIDNITNVLLAGH